MANREESFEIFQDLLLHGPFTGRSALRQALVGRASAPWSHAEAQEKNMAGHAGGDADVMVFVREAADGLAAAALVLWSQPEGYSVTNIVPRDVSELGYRGYNAILQDFFTRIAHPAASNAGFTAEMTPSVDFR